MSHKSFKLSKKSAFLQKNNVPIIRVSGNVGSGKTTLCEMLAKELGYKYYYTDQIFRDMAKEKNLSIEEFYEQMKNDPETEKRIDIKQMNIMLETDDIIVQGRMATEKKDWHSCGKFQIVLMNLGLILF